MAPSWNSFRFWGIIIAVMSFLAGMGINAITFAAAFDSHMQDRVDQAASLLSGSVALVAKNVEAEKAERKQADADLETRYIRNLQLLRDEMRDLKVEVRDSKPKGSAR